MLWALMLGRNGTADLGCESQKVSLVLLLIYYKGSCSSVFHRIWECSVPNSFLVLFPKLWGLRNDLEEIYSPSARFVSEQDSPRISGATSPPLAQLGGGLLILPALFVLTLLNVFCWS